MVISVLGQREEKWGIRSDNPPSIEWLFGRVNSMGDTLSILKLFKALPSHITSHVACREQGHNS
jgi:hypothetical protein